jgi:hypothetical protein
LQTLTRQQGSNMRLLPAEKLTANLILTLAIIDAVLLVKKGVSVDVVGYLRVLSIGGLLMGVGQFYRFYRSDERIALATTAAGLFILFTIVGSVFNYLLLPVEYGSFDASLSRFDQTLSFSWLAFVEWVPTVPHLGSTLRFVYLSSLPQMIVVILILGFTKAQHKLHLFLLTGLIGGLATICIWAVMPSFGAIANHQVPAETEAQLSLVVGSEYVRELKRLAAEGVSYISPDDLLGLVGFPSFHTIMACLSVWFLFGVRRIWLPFLMLNLVMIPAIIVHGGHHLADVLGGMAIFVLSLMLAKQAMRQLYGSQNDKPSELAGVA